ncbi:MAG: hypothetical protein ACI9YE_000824 [Psychroserpens sp.]|jgi:hypothetical protein
MEETKNNKGCLVYLGVCFLISLLLYYSCGNNNESKETKASSSSESITNNTLAFKTVKDFLFEANITVYEISEFDSHLIVRIEKPANMARPEGIAEIICSLIADKGSYSMVALRDFDGNSIARSICK